MTADDLRKELQSLEGRLLTALASSEERLSGGLSGIRAEVGGLRVEVGGLRADVSRVQADLIRLRADTTDNFEHVTEALESLHRRLSQDQAGAV